MAAIEARNVSKRFLLHREGASALKVRFLDLIHPSRRLPAEEFWALRDVSFDIDRGEAVGLIGRNGSGKSTLLKAIAGIHCPTSGHLRVPRSARIGTVIELGVGFHGELSGRENVFLNAAIHGLSREETHDIYGPVVEYSGLAHFMDLPLKTYSSGMHTRLGFAVAAMLRPDILLLDEVFAVGDEDFQRRCMKTMQEFGARGTTVVFVSHAPQAIRTVCQRVCVLDGGRIVYDGSVGGGLEHYHALMQATEARRVDADRPAPRLAEASEAELDAAWHRRALGGRWAESGTWEYDFLREQGLAPAQFVLDLGCGSLAGARHLLPFMEPAHYWGFEIDRALFDAGVTIELARAGVAAERGHFIVNDRFDLADCPYTFDVAIANSFFRRLPLNRLARCVAATMAKLKPGGRLFATWFDNPNPCDFRPMARPGRVVSYSDGEPFHYSYDMIARVCELLGCRVERVQPRCPHPRGESVLAITRDEAGR